MEWNEANKLACNLIEHEFGELKYKPEMMLESMSWEAEPFKELDFSQAEPTDEEKMKLTQEIFNTMNGMIANTGKPINEISSQEYCEMVLDVIYADKVSDILCNAIAASVLRLQNKNPSQ